MPGSAGDFRLWKIQRHVAKKAIEVYGRRSRKIHYVIQECLSPLGQVQNSVCLLDKVFLSL